jgi:hypothetical protein
MNIENNNDLIKFIELEKKTVNNTSNEKIIDMFYKCFFKTLIETNIKFKNIDNFKKSVYIGSNIMFNVFWIILNYTNNLTLTIFLSERAILLFSEFIILSRDPSINKDLCYIPNLSDAINFAYKKTVGPIEIKSLSIIKNNNIKNTCFLIKEIIQTFYLKYDDISIHKIEIFNICDLITKLHKNLDDDKLFFVLLKKIMDHIQNNTVIKTRQFLTDIIKYKHSKTKMLLIIND